MRPLSTFLLVSITSNHHRFILQCLRVLFDRFSAAYEVPSNNLIKELADEYNDAETVEMAFAEDIEEMIDTSSSSSAPGLLRGRISSFEEKKRVKDLNYWLACESGACADTKFWEEKMKELTSGPDKRNALKHLREAIAATLRAEAHLSNDFMPAWEAFKEKHGAAKAEQWADNWEDSHEIILSYNEEDGDVFEVKRPIVIYCESIKE
jgi:hypothetical protein